MTQQKSKIYDAIQDVNCQDLSLLAFRDSKKNNLYRVFTYPIVFPQSGKVMKVVKLLGIL